MSEYYMINNQNFYTIFKTSEILHIWLALLSYKVFVYGTLSPRKLSTRHAKTTYYCINAQYR